MRTIIAAVLITAFITPTLAQERPIEFPPNPLLDGPQEPQPPDIFGSRPGNTARDRLLRRMREVRDAYRREYGKHDPVGEITECAEVGSVTTCYTHPF